MHWVEQAKKQDLFTTEWLENIRAAYTELYHEANSLRYQYQEGQRDAASAGINGLLQRYSVIETLLSEFTPD